MTISLTAGSTTAQLSIGGVPGPIFDVGGFASVNITSSTTLNAGSHAGRIVQLLTNNLLDITLPLGSTMTAGQSIVVRGYTIGNLVWRQGSDTISASHSSGLTTMPINKGTQTTFLWDGAVWQAFVQASNGFDMTAYMSTTVNAGSFIVGRQYEIVTPGTTTFTSIGATANTAGTVFTATGAGSGTGTAIPSVELNVGESFWADFTAQASMPLRVQCNTLRKYKIEYNVSGDNPAAAGTTGARLQMNNKAYTTQIGYRYILETNTTYGANGQNDQADGFPMDGSGNSAEMSLLVVHTTTGKKRAQSWSGGTTNTVSVAGFMHSFASSGAAQTDAWVSLGTVAFPVDHTGRVHVKREA